MSGTGFHVVQESVTFAPVLGAILLVGALILFPVVVLMSSTVAAALLGQTLKERSEVVHAGSELIELNR